MENICQKQKLTKNKYIVSMEKWKCISCFSNISSKKIKFINKKSLVLMISIFHCVSTEFPFYIGEFFSSKGPRYGGGLSHTVQMGSP